MQFKAKALYIRYSPYKLRPLADVVRGKTADYALHYLATFPSRRVRPIKKMLESAVANAKYLDNSLAPADLLIKDLRIDHGPTYRYYRPGAMGRAYVARKKFSHLSVVLEPLERKEA